MTLLVASASGSAGRGCELGPTGSVVGEEMNNHISESVQGTWASISAFNSRSVRTSPYSLISVVSSLQLVTS